MKKVVRVTEKDIESMIRRIMKEDMSWPWSKKETEKPSDITPRGIKSTVYPDQQLRSVSTVKATPMEKNPLVDRKVDPYFMQEISDRLHGPDGEQYMKEIEKLNEKFPRKRGGRVAGQLHDPNISAEAKRREREINQKIR
jgi:hypothetical protein